MPHTSLRVTPKLGCTLYSGQLLWEMKTWLWAPTTNTSVAPTPHTPFRSVLGFWVPTP